jgi:hypothetical protein
MSSTHSTTPAGIHAGGDMLAAMRHAMVAVDRAALAHDLAGEDDPDVREFLTRELDALEAAR